MTEQQVDAFGDPIVFSGEIHPYADRWPMRTADELEAMAQSIKARGLRFPIILSPAGVLVDGRNRLRACEIAGVEPKFDVRYVLDSDAEIAEFIWDVNGDLRRHMKKGALAMLAALKPGPQRLVSNQAQVSQAYIAKARTVIEFCDEAAVQSVIDDHVALDDAYAEAQKIKATVQAEEIAERQRKAAEKAEAEKRKRQLDDLRGNRADLAALVDDGKLSIEDALTIRRKDIAAEAKRAEAERQATRNLINDAHLAFTIIHGYRHPETVRRVLDNWAPQVRDWTAADIRELASILNAVADQWEITK